MRTAFIIDDHSDTAESLCMLLQSMGFAAESFNDFKSVEQRMKQTDPCIMFIDYHVSETESTPEFVRRVSASHPSLKVVIVSGDLRKKDEADKLGAEFLVKPVDIAVFEKICKKYCQ